MAKTLHFGSPASYKSWLAFGHMHGKFRHHGGKGTPKIVIAGKAHRVAHSNPAELVVFGNPSLCAAVQGARDANPTWMKVAGVSGKLLDVRGDTPATIEYLIEKRDGSKVWLKPRVGPATKKNRAKNPHPAGCSCAICKNARGEKHAPGCGCAICRRKRGVNGQKNPSAIINRAANPRRKKKSRRRNQGDDLAQSRKLYSDFHGKDPAGVITRQTSDKERLEYAALGDLGYLKVLPLEKPEVKIDFEGDRVKLASSPDGSQLYLIGGNQNVSALLDKFTEDASKDFVELGVATEVQYFTHKAMHDFKPVDYFHKFGEESGVAPIAVFNQLKKEIFLVGGEYHVEAPGIVN